MVVQRDQKLVALIYPDTSAAGSKILNGKNMFEFMEENRKEVNKVLFKQTLIFFMMPLSLAIVHTLVGLEFCKFILSSIGVNNILNGSIMTFVFLLIIYGIYFMVTYFCSKNIIKERYEDLSKQLLDPEVLKDVKKTRELSKESSELEEIVNCYDKYKKLEADIEAAKEMFEYI